MEKKLFPQDKNYILKEVQQYVKHRMLEIAAKKALENFQKLQNPLGLEDDFILDLKSKFEIRQDFLLNSYELLSDIYRFYFGQVQLEFLWDGKTHYDHYESEWLKKFEEWQDELALDPDYTRIIIKGVHLHEPNPGFLQESLSRIILRHFKIKKSRRGLLIAA